MTATAATEEKWWVQSRVNAGSIPQSFSEVVCLTNQVNTQPLVMSDD
jgi:hypothetical protein